MELSNLDLWTSIVGFFLVVEVGWTDVLYKDT